VAKEDQYNQQLAEKVVHAQLARLPAEVVEVERLAHLSQTAPIREKGTARKTINDFTAGFVLA
jgi:citrate lyase synthetase